MTGTFKLGGARCHKFPVMKQVKTLGDYVQDYIDAARASADSRDWHGVWSSLGMAHVLSQPLVWPHTRVHAWMLWFGLRTGNLREAFGQLLRIVLTPIGTALGRLPVGNPGLVRYSVLEPMPIPEEAARIFETVGVSPVGVTSSISSRSVART